MVILAERIKEHDQACRYYEPTEPITIEQIEKAEQILGFKLPNLLRELYLELGNGGFLRGGFLSLDEQDLDTTVAWYEFTALGLYEYIKICWEQTYPDLDQWEKTFKEVLPICYAGCTCYYVLDCRVEDGPVWFCQDEALLKIAAPTLQDWLEDKLREKPLEDEYDEIDPEDIPF